MWVFMMSPLAPVEAWPVLERHSTVTYYYTVFQAYMLGNSMFDPAAPPHSVEAITSNVHRTQSQSLPGEGGGGIHSKAISTTPNHILGQSAHQMYLSLYSVWRKVVLGHQIRTFSHRGASMETNEPGYLGHCDHPTHTLQTDSRYGLKTRAATGKHPQPSGCRIRPGLNLS